jgi:hypothetical protein
VPKTAGCGDIARATQVEALKAWRIAQPRIHYDVFGTDAFDASARGSSAAAAVAFIRRVLTPGVR